MYEWEEAMYGAGSGQKALIQAVSGMASGQVAIPVSGAGPGGGGFALRDLSNGGGVIPGQGTTPNELGFLEMALALVGAAGIAIPEPITTGLGIAAVGYAGAQALGVEFPWETVKGEGFIAPWTKGVITMNGKTMQAPAIPGDAVVSGWSAGGHMFYRLASGKLGTFTKRGMWKTWRPYRSIVMGKTVKAGTVKRFSRRIKSHAKALRTVLRIVK